VREGAGDEDESWAAKVPVINRNAADMMVRLKVLTWFSFSVNHVSSRLNHAQRHIEYIPCH
jgi:hypothetical protein